MKQKYSNCKKYKNKLIFLKNCNLKLIKNGRKDIKIIVYGKNCNDEKIYTRHSQLTTLGFYNVFVYTGGIFEWLLLQDVYGVADFPCTKKELDILKYKSNKVLNVSLLEY